MGRPDANLGREFSTSRTGPTLLVGTDRGQGHVAERRESVDILTEGAFLSLLSR